MARVFRGALVPRRPSDRDAAKSGARKRPAATVRDPPPPAAAFFSPRASGAAYRPAKKQKPYSTSASSVGLRRLSDPRELQEWHALLGKERCDDKRPSESDDDVVIIIDDASP